MKGSQVNNIKFDASKQKLVPCEACGKSVVVGKFAKKEQKCEACRNPTKNVGAREKVQEVRRISPVKVQDKPSSFASQLATLANKLEFEITDRRLWRKKYAIDGGGIATIHIMVEPGITGQDPKLGYFSIVIQRAVGLNDDFRKMMPPDAASDCELLVSELGGADVRVAQIGQEVCASCGQLTDQFGVRGNKVLCVRPNNCFKRAFNSRGAEAEE
jgi:hypothetical protein